MKNNDAGSTGSQVVAFTSFSVLLLLFGLALLIGACGAAQPSGTETAGGLGSDSAATTATRPGATPATQPAATTATEPAPPSGSASTGTTGSEDALRPLSFDKVGFVELLRPSLGTYSTEHRRILSPAADAEAVRQLIDAYALAVPVAGGASAIPPEEIDTRMVIHLRDGSAIVFSGSSSNQDACLLTRWQEDRADAEGGMHKPVASDAVRAPELLEAVTAARDADPGSQPGPSHGQSPVGLPETMPTDFAFVAAFSTYGHMVLDTFAGAFYKDMVLPENTTSRAELRLTAKERAEAYRRLRQLEVLTYPADFVPKQNGGVTPNQTYYLRLRAGGVEKEIRWNDTTLSADAQAVALRGWFKWLEQLIYAKPEYNALPEFRGGYA